MRINNYKIFLENKISIDDKHTIDYICRKYDIINYTINDDGTIDVEGGVSLCHKSLTKLPLKFGKVNGYFDCGHNQLTSLEGSPYWVGDFFSCKNNQLTSLEDFDGSYVNFSNNPVNELLKNIPKDLHIKFIYWCNEYDAIDKGISIPERIEEVYNKLGLKYEEN